MPFYNKTTSVYISESQVRKWYWDNPLNDLRTSFSKNIHGVELAKKFPDNTIIWVENDSKPTATALQKVERGLIEERDGAYYQTWAVVDKYSTTDEENECLSCMVQEAKTNIKNSINKYREDYILQGMLYTFPDSITGTIQLREQDFRNILGRAMKGILLASQSDTTTTAVFRDLENQDHNLTGPEMLVMATAVDNFLTACYTKSWEHKAAIDAITPVDPTDLSDVNDAITLINNYDYTTGWPT